MPLQNRVDPFGRLHAINARGAWLGNRGIIHNQQKIIVAPWRNKSWVTCKLQFKGIKRSVFRMGTYSEIFFLDEATAFSAGHRPCARCRKTRFGEFKATWIAANFDRLSAKNPSVAQIDKLLHTERVDRSGGKTTFEVPFQHVPPGAFIELGGEAFLFWHGNLLRWTFSRYTHYRSIPSPDTYVPVLTPATIVRTFRAGFVPEVDATCDGRD